jgi:hypothetical protein
MGVIDVDQKKRGQLKTVWLAISAPPPVVFADLIFSCFRGPKACLDFVWEPVEFLLTLDLFVVPPPQPGGETSASGFQPQESARVRVRPEGAPELWIARI